MGAIALVLFVSACSEDTKIVTPHWYSLDEPKDKKFEPSFKGRTCSVVKVVAIGEARTEKPDAGYDHVLDDQKLKILDTLGQTSDEFESTRVGRDNIIQASFNASYKGFQFLKKRKNGKIEPVEENAPRNISRILGQGEPPPLGKAVFVCLIAVPNVGGINPTGFSWVISYYLE